MAWANRDIQFDTWSNLLQYALLIVTISLLAVSLIAPIYPHEQALQHAPTVVVIAAMTVAARKQIFSLPTFTCIVMFFWLHILGARYIYSFVPYDFWAERFLGTSMSNLPGWNRNHYDRIVHLLFGCLATPPAAELESKFRVRVLPL